MKPRILSTARLSFPLATAIASLLAGYTAHAGTIWDGGGGATTNIDTATNWDSNVVNALNGTTAATFGSTTGSTATINVDASFTGITFNRDANFTIANGAGSLTVGSGGINVTLPNTTARTYTISESSLILGANQTWTINNNTGTAALNVSGVISDAGLGRSLTKSGTGNLLLQGANTFSGATIVDGGILTIQNYAGLDNTSSITVSGGSAILSFAVVGTGAASDTISKNLSLHGTLRTSGGTSANTLALTWNGNITLAGNSTINNHGNGSIDVNGQVDLAANTLTFQADQAGARIDGNIIGSGGLIKTGAQTLTITGANTYTGVTSISTGSLTLGSTGALGTTPGVNGTSGITIGGASAATLTSSTTGITIAAPITTANTGVTSTISFAVTTSGGSIALNGAIGGNGNVAYTTPNVSSGGNTNTINLGAAGTYAGSTTINTGNINNNLVLRNASGAADVLPTSTVLTFGTGAGPTSVSRTTTLDLNGQNQTFAGLGSLAAVAVPDGRNHRVNSTAAATLTINSTADQTFGGTTVAGSLTTSAQITGAISLVKNGTGTFTLGGLLTGGASASGNTFTGSTTVLGGILVLGETRSIQNSAFDTAASVTGTSTAGLRTTVTALTLGGLTGGNDFATRFTSTTGGYTGLTALTLNPGTGVTNSYAGDIGDGATGMNLSKTGAGTQTLTGTNTHTGTTTVSAGVLAVNGTLANTSATTVSGTGTLKGSGSIASSVTISSGGTLASGTSIQSLATGALSFTTGSNFEYELDKDAADNVAGDLTAVTGDLSLSGTVTLNLLETGIGAWELGNPLGDHLLGSPAADKLTLISYTGTWNGGLFTYLGNLVQDDSSIMLNGQRWWFNYNDNDAGTNFTGDLTGSSFVTMTVPEPDAAALLGALGVLVLFRRRRN